MRGEEWTLEEVKRFLVRCLVGPGRLWASLRGADGKISVVS